MEEVYDKDVSLVSPLLFNLYLNEIPYLLKACNSNNNNNNKFIQYYHFVQVLPIKIILLSNSIIQYWAIQYWAIFNIEQYWAIFNIEQYWAIQ